jgi:ribonuclease-3
VKRQAGEAYVEATLAELEAALGHGFRAPELLVRALTHRSLAKERAALEHQHSLEYLQAVGQDEPGDNERLEFLGDAVLAWWLPSRFSGSIRTGMRAS